MKPIAELIRFVVGPDGAVVPDLKRRLPGRGVWVTATRQALAEARSRARPSPGASSGTFAPTADLVDMTERLLERAALDALAIAHKAGQVAIGFAKVEAALARATGRGAAPCRRGRPGRGAQARRLPLQRREDAAEIAVIGAFTSAQLDLALGRSNVIHAALLAGPASETFLARAARLDRFQGADSGLTDIGKD